VFGGRLYAGGLFTFAGGAPIHSLAAWNGSTWAPAGDPSGRVRTLAVRSTIDVATTYLFAGGDFGTIGGVAAQRVEPGDALSGNWAPVGSGLPGARCDSLLVRITGLRTFELTATTWATTLAPAAVHRWTGSSWQALGAIDDARTPFEALLTFRGGSYVVALRDADSAVRRFDGASWAPVAGPGIDGEVRALLDLGSEVVLGGAFRTIDGQPRNGLGRGGAGAWQPLGSGVDGTVLALVRAADGDVLAAGQFTTAGGLTANHVAGRCPPACRCTGFSARRCANPRSRRRPGPRPRRAGCPGSGSRARRPPGRPAARATA
jgi:hypothetical protein